MTIDLHKKRRIKQLRELYQFDVAFAKQAGHEFESEQEELEVLACLHLSRSIQKEVIDYLNVVEVTNPTQLVMIGTICNEALGKMAGRLEKLLGSEAIDKVFEAVDIQREKFRNDSNEQ